MKKIIKLTETDLINLVKRVIKEQEDNVFVVIPQLKQQDITFYKTPLEDKEVKPGQSSTNFFGNSKSVYLKGTLFGGFYLPKTQEISINVVAWDYDEATSGMGDRPSVRFSCKTKTFTEKDLFSGDETIYNKQLKDWLVVNVCNKYQNKKFDLPLNYK